MMTHQLFLFQQSLSTMIVLRPAHNDRRFELHPFFAKACHFRIANNKEADSSQYPIQQKQNRPSEHADLFDFSDGLFAVWQHKRAANTAIN